MSKRLFLAVLLLWSCIAAAADPYPSKPIRMILPFPPGGGTDVVGRVLAQHMSASMGQPIVVENRTGASGTIGTNLIAKSPPDTIAAHCTASPGAARTCSIPPAFRPPMAPSRSAIAFPGRTRPW